jgi:hypothetical protein
MFCRSTVRALVLAACAVASPATIAQQGPGVLARAKRLNCSFSLVATGSWANGATAAAVTPSDLVIQFLSIDVDSGTAEAVGKFGPSDIIAKSSRGSLHFLQTFREGPLYLTTIFEKESRPGKFSAVHSRHELTDVRVPGYTSNPEQYYGECEIAQ